jgi:outer membrane protein assembly factor BamB
MHHRLLLACLALLLITSFASRSEAQNWTRFRGPNGTGLSDAKDIPTTWTKKDYNWKVKIPGVGHSQPVIWGNKLFLTSALAKGNQRVVLCLDIANGKVLWEKSYAANSHRLHPLNSYASATPTVDKDLVYVTFAHPKKNFLVALDHTGNEKWQYDLGEIYSLHGLALSPILFEDTVILGKEQGRKAPEGTTSFIVALDRKTGKERWKTPRGIKYVSYSTPCIYEAPDGSARLVCSSTSDGMTSLDARTGKTIWSRDCFVLRTVSSSVMAGGLAFGSCGSGGGGNYLVAVRIGGKGELDKSYEKYRVKQAAGYVPTPLVKGKMLFMFADKGGIVSCIEAATGKRIWRERIDKSMVFSGSPICVQDRIYAVTHSGEVLVIAADDEFRLLARNDLGEASRCTPAVAHGRMYLRTFNEDDEYTHLISIGGKKATP